MRPIAPDAARFRKGLHTARTCRVASPFPASNPSGIAGSRKGRCNSPMGGPSRRRIFGDRVRGAKISAEHARQRAKEAAREADAAECLLWSEQMEGFGGPAQPSPTIAQCLNGGYGGDPTMAHVEDDACAASASKPTLPLLRAGSGPRNTGLSDTRGLDVLRRKVAFWLQREDAVEREQTKASGVADWK